MKHGAVVVFDNDFNAKSSHRKEEKKNCPMDSPTKIKQKSSPVDWEVAGSGFPFAAVCHFILTFLPNA